MDYPEYVKIGEKKYKINTDFRVAIDCQEIALDETIGDYERALAVIYKLFGDDGLEDFDNHQQLLELAKKYLSCGKEIEGSNEEPDMDYKQDYGYIWASMYSDYNGLDIDKENIHWWKFMELMNGLSNSEMGNCCVLNRIRNLRNYDTKDIKDPKELKKINDAKQQVALKKNNKANKISNEQKQNIDNFYKKTGLSRKE